MKFGSSHLAYCTNIHPAESWDQTRHVLATELLAVRDQLRNDGLLAAHAPFAIGLRLSAMAARELLDGRNLDDFRHWLDLSNTYVFTINGFPYGNFHGTRVKEQVFRPDWSDPARLAYTRDLFTILTTIARPGTAVSVSTLPGSHKSFAAKEAPMLRHLLELTDWLDDLSARSNHDCHLGLEPEPLGHFENTNDTIGFFSRLRDASRDPVAVERRIGINFDTCHFALEFESPRKSLDTLHAAGIRLSKLHLSNALAFDPSNTAAMTAIAKFDEPVYFHQVLLRNSAGNLTRFADLSDFLSAAHAHPPPTGEARVHFHIPLDAEPALPLRSTREAAIETLAWHYEHPDACEHLEIETYTWGVLPAGWQRPLTEQIAAEFAWVLAPGQALR